MKTHQMTRTRFYRTWASMLRRCDSPSQDSYKFYGARGIRVCGRWSTFTNFMDDMLASYEAHVAVHGEKQTTLDRRNANKDYSPENCAWATQNEQARSRRTTRLITFKGETKSMPDWAEQVGLTYDTVKLRLRRGWTVEKTLTTGRLVNQYS